jgi:hypothetical protein
MWRKGILFLVFGLVSLGFANAQKISTNQVFASIGVGPSLPTSVLVQADRLPYVRATFEKGFMDIDPGVLSIGGSLSLGYASRTVIDQVELDQYNIPYKYSKDLNYITMILGLRAAWHYNFGTIDPSMNGLNAYAGSTLGLRRIQVSENIISGSTPPNYEPDKSYTKPYFSLLIGASYFFKDNMGAYLESGYPTTMVGLIFLL